jgi:hypothetical protein
MRMLWAGLAAIWLAAMAAAGPAAAATAPKPLFASREVIRLTIKGPIASVAQGPADSEKTVAGSLTVQGATPETLAISLTPRGITRRRKDVCTFQPLRVEFTDKPAATSVFRGQKRLKLVTHCRSPAGFQQYLLLEYSAYRMYNVLTPASFNVRLVSVDYADETGRPITSRLGFFIEDADDVAERNGLTRVRTTNRVPVAQLSPRDAARFVMFQDMISNLDWAMTAGPAGDECCHNSRLIGAKDATSGFIPVPYDFDFSGMVDAPYASPPAEIPLANVRVRRYRGFCRHNAEAQAAAADLLTRRAALLAVLNDVPQLEEKTRQKASAYVAGFFDQIGSEADVAKLLQRCLTGGPA